ncbi:FAD synthase [Hyalella azteca]|uniref:FAD synthase n=1 Tax=Hyalella azteca TaxID=294128 RepID=A0A8B7N4L9_HYAAZ|nr:FAD synthase [Hyalella azteca]
MVLRLSSAMSTLAFPFIRSAKIPFPFFLKSKFLVQGCAVSSLCSKYPSEPVWRQTNYLRPLNHMTSTMDKTSGSSTSITSSNSPTAGIIVIGDEILKGRTQDTNSHFIAQKLYKLGIRVKKVVVIGDDLSAICNEVRLFSSQFTYVITSGGIGPTHDDVTFQGIANAFNEPLIPHPELVTFIGNYFKTSDLSTPPMKMAHIPASSSLVYAEDRATGYKSKFPVVCVRNVTVLPGVPGLLEKSFVRLAKQLYGDHRHVHCVDLYMSVDEVTLAAAMNNTVAAFPSVTIGSYPQLTHSYYKTLLTIESQDSAAVDAAKQHLLNQIDADYEVKGYVRDSLSGAWPRLHRLLQEKPALEPRVTHALQVLSDCLQQYRPEEISVCFNGGKDCLAVLHLYYLALNQRLCSADAATLPTIQAVYIKEQNSFPQITKFVDETINRYALNCTILEGPLKNALHQLQRQQPNIKAVIMGTRHSDPYSDSLSAFQRTDSDWPHFMRVHPILPWDYKTVWDFIRGLFLPYCTLYDRGYTSLGNASNTTQNPQLLTTDRLGAPTYKPAYLLDDGNAERSGRT